LIAGRGTAKRYSLTGLKGDDFMKTIWAILAVLFLATSGIAQTFDTNSTPRPTSRNSKPTVGKASKVVGDRRRHSQEAGAAFDAELAKKGLTQNRIQQRGPS
jgi:hypothetical protein